MSEGQTNSQLKVLFPVEQDEDGYPPVAAENLWVRHTHDDLYEIDNIPFFVLGISYRDIVSAERDSSGTLTFKFIVCPSSHSTIRVILFDERDVSTLQRTLAVLGCESEKDVLAKLVAVDVPPNVSIQSVWEFLRDGVHKGLWEYEDAAIRHTPFLESHV